MVVRDYSRSGVDEVITITVVAHDVIIKIVMARVPH
jgi:hypothetical protein